MVVAYRDAEKQLQSEAETVQCGCAHALTIVSVCHRSVSDNARVADGSTRAARDPPPASVLLRQQQPQGEF